MQKLESPRTAFFFLRHGQSTANQEGIIAGQLDVPLTDGGREQAESAGRLLAGQGIDRIVSSRLARAQETARIVGKAIGIPVQTIASLEERHWGQMEGSPIAQRSDYFMSPPMGESWEVFRARMTEALDETAPGPRTLIVGHAGTWRVICWRLDLPPEAGAIPNATPIRVHHAGSTPPWAVVEAGG